MDHAVGFDNAHYLQDHRIRGGAQEEPFGINLTTDPNFASKHLLVT